MKTAVKSLVCHIVSKLPPGGRQAVFERLCEMRGPNNVFLEMAAARHVIDVSVSGAYGTIRQSISDRAILPEYMKTGRWAEETNRSLEEFFRTKGSGTYIDVGANIGLTTIPIAQNPNVRCIALEPEPKNFEYLKHNVEANCHHGNVTLEQIAAFSKRGTLLFEISPVNFGGHRIRLREMEGHADQEWQETIKVDALPLDDIAPRDPGPLAVKIDTEGGEPFVAAGGHYTLSRADLILMEFWPYGMNRMGGDPEVIFHLIASGFKTVRYSEGEKIHSSAPEPVAAATEKLRQLFQIRKHDSSFYLNLVISR